MKSLRLAVLALCCLAASACATPGPVNVNGAVASALSVARSGVDATANAFNAALYGLDFAMDAKLLTPGSAEAKQIAAIGRQVQSYLNMADTALRAGNSAGAKAALDQANALIGQFNALLPAKHVTSMAAPPLSPHVRADILQRAAA